MAAPAGGSAGASDSLNGGGTAPADLAGTLRHLLAVDEDDYDCNIDLVLAEAAVAEGASEAGEEWPAKRAKKAPAVTCRASLVALKQHSEVFRQVQAVAFACCMSARRLGRPACLPVCAFLCQCTIGKR